MSKGLIENLFKIDKNVIHPGTDSEPSASLGLIRCKEFVEKYSSGGSGLDFARDFGRLFSNLQMRIRREERILYVEYLEPHDQK